METLEECISVLRPVELRSFRDEISLTHKGRKDKELLEALQLRSGDPRAVARQIYAKENLPAYHALRKRLLASLASFMARVRQSSAVTASGSARTWFLAAQMLEERQRGAAAFHLLRKAEREARKHDQLEMLDEIYRYILAHAGELGADPGSFLAPWRENRERLHRLEQLQVANSLLRQRLRALRNVGGVLDLDEVTDEVLREVAITRETANDVRFMHALSMTLRNAVISTKNYYRFEPFVLRVFRGLEKVQAFQPFHRAEYLGFMYMIAHVLYRNRRMREAGTWLDRIEQEVHGNTDVLPGKLASTFVQLRAAVLSYSGNNTAATASLESALKRLPAGADPTDRLNMMLNLAVYKFQARDFKGANHLLQSMGHTDHWLVQRMGLEWVFKRALIEVIVFVELGHDDLALNRIRSIDTQFHQFFEHPAYQRARVFIRFIRQVIEHPSRARSAAFAAEVEKASLGLPGDREDIQAITFYCWLKSRMEGREYYEVLIEAMNKGERH